MKREYFKAVLAAILAVAAAFLVCGCGDQSSSAVATTKAAEEISTTTTETTTQTTTEKETTSSTTKAATQKPKTNKTSSGNSGGSSYSADATELYLKKFSSVPSSGTITGGSVSVGQNILINNDYAYDFSQDTDFIYFSDLSGRKFNVMFADLDVDRFTGYEFNLMTKAFKSIYPDEYLGVCSGFRTYKTQKRNFDNSVAKVGEKETLKWYTRPGYSEHHTGYAIDFNTDSYGSKAFTGNGNQSWFRKNCHKYGFIHRYTAAKQSITGINPEAWHFRQVGIPHADYIMKNDICYEEYISLLKSHGYDSPIKVTPDAGGTYYIWYQAGKKGTSINVSGYSKYYCSGNNVDGFIITAIK